MYLADHYDGAILDIMMPKMDGITVLKNIRAQGKLDVLFERFYRLDSSRNSGTGGSGIGLSVVKAIVQAHKGKITAENKTGNGLTITVLL
ncbi:ATP-binding protein [Blautia sp. Marseille-P3087]|uniref:ATP-binding protein n=1 Tax=Blautia sp. Marseille-P3087 TaxID=1917876 RepID=UPI000930467A|nr:ATP-binding protein [Blautia sp. Marseille-P3087]